ncbi:MAG TPA: GNAT family N-acetyltransferase, partial [Dermatophilaceae bacterium]|nr:GNAT family N-acetyltransferase [Dermatophilaceae bacterium]
MPSTAAALREASTADVPAIAAIYGHAVRHGVATFDVDDPPAETWLGKLDGPMLVAELAGGIAGFAYAVPFRTRPAYRLTRETSVYLRPEARGRGLGTRLYGELLARLREDGIHLAVAVVAQPNPASNALHERLGFTEAGTLTQVGRKFDR